MKLWQAILFAILQGVTEFLPVSSSGHLVLLKQLFGLESSVDVSFDVMLHVGTLIAVCAVYWKDVYRLFIEFIEIVKDLCANLKIFIDNKKTQKASEEDGVDWELKPYRKIVKSAYRKFVVLVIVSTIPTAIIGLLERKFVEDIVVRTSLLPGIFLLITGLTIALLDLIPDGWKTPKQTSYKDAAVIGVVQGLATLPGISRSGSTITAGVAVGLRKDFAIKYSFIMSIPAILGALVLEIPDIFSKKAAAGAQFGNYFIGMIVSAVVGFICIKTLLKLIRDRKMSYFTFYCLAVGAIAIITSFF